MSLTMGEYDVLVVLADFQQDSKTLDALLAYVADPPGQPALRLMTRASLARTLGALQRKGMTSKRIDRGTAVYKIMPYGVRSAAAYCENHGLEIPGPVRWMLRKYGDAAQQPEPPAEDWAGNGFTVGGGEITVPCEFVALAAGERVCTIYDLPGTSPILALGITTTGRLLYGVRAGQGWAMEPQWVGICGARPSQLQDVLEQVTAELGVIDRQNYPSTLRLMLRDAIRPFGFPGATLAEVQSAIPGGIDRRQVIGELARMRDDGFVIFEGPRYRLNPGKPLAD